MPKINTSVITDKSITKEKLNDELQGKINNIGNLPSLRTNVKDTLVNSINELYNDTVNGKNLVADAIRQKGVQIGGGPSYQELHDKILQIDGRKEIIEKGVNVSLYCPMWEYAWRSVTDQTYEFDFSHVITPLIYKHTKKGDDVKEEIPHEFDKSVRGLLGKSLLKNTENYDSGFVDSILYSKSSNTVKVKSKIFTNYSYYPYPDHYYYTDPIDCFYIFEFNNKKISVYEHEQDIPYNDYTYIWNQKGRTTTQIYPNRYITQYTYFWIDKLQLFYQHTTGDERLGHQKSYTYPLFVNYDNEVFIGIGKYTVDPDENNDITVHDIFFSPCRLTIS